MSLPLMTAGTPLNVTAALVAQRWRCSRTFPLADEEENHKDGPRRGLLLHEVLVHLNIPNSGGIHWPRFLQESPQVQEHPQTTQQREPLLW